MLKDTMSKYEPGKRHWLKVQFTQLYFVKNDSCMGLRQVKKDYLADGAMADTADLVVLGGWYGTGNKVNNCQIG